MIHLIRMVLGWTALLILAAIAVLVIRINPHGSAQLLQDANRRAGAVATQAASHLPSGEQP